MYTEFGPPHATLYADPTVPHVSRARCFSFWYYMAGNCGELSVYVHVVEKSKTRGKPEICLNWAKDASSVAGYRGTFSACVYIADQGKTRGALARNLSEL